jgi:hypothetical protein
MTKGANHDGFIMNASGNEKSTLIFFLELAQE